MTSVFLPRYPELCKVPTNPYWCLYAMGRPHEGQAPRSSNSVKSCRSSPRASGAPIPAPLGRFPPSPLSSFQPKRHESRSLWYTVAVMTQTRLSRSRKTLAPLGIITTARARAEGLCGLSCNIPKNVDQKLIFGAWMRERVVGRWMQSQETSEASFLSPTKP
jgi:hypothetical protein